MKGLSLFLLWCVFACGQSTPLPSAEKEVSNPGVGAPRHPLGTIDILSDTQGVDFGPYLRLILPTIRKNWLHVIPVSAETKKGKLAIEFAITGEGRVENLRLVATSGDAVLDRPAWDSIISSNPFPPLPSEFTGPFLALRLRFYYNPDSRDLTVIKISISVPHKLQIQTGDSETVSATVRGTEEKTVEWRVSGLGCSGIACGEMKGDLYVAPTIPPEPPLVTLTAVSKADPTVQASITVTIIRPTPSH